MTIKWSNPKSNPIFFLRGVNFRLILFPFGFMCFRLQLCYPEKYCIQVWKHFLARHSKRQAQLAHLQRFCEISVPYQHQRWHRYKERRCDKSRNALMCMHLFLFAWYVGLRTNTVGFQAKIKTLAHLWKYCWLCGCATAAWSEASSGHGCRACWEEKGKLLCCIVAAATEMGSRLSWSAP